MNAPSDSMGDLQCDIGNLHHLLSIMCQQVNEQEFVRPDGSRNTFADEICALAMIARDLAERLNEAAEACHSKVMADAKKG
jgi:hypothetical protein